MEVSTAQRNLSIFWLISIRLDIKKLCTDILCYLSLIFIHGVYPSVFYMDMLNISNKIPVRYVEIANTPYSSTLIILQVYCYILSVVRMNIMMCRSGILLVIGDKDNISELVSTEFIWAENILLTWYCRR